VSEAEAAAARARVLEWKIQLQSPPGGENESLPVLPPVVKGEQP